MEMFNLKVEANIHLLKNHRQSINYRMRMEYLIFMNQHLEIIRMKFQCSQLTFHRGFGEMWERKVKRIKAESPYGNNLRWRMMPLIVKAGEEVLQEEFAMQLIVQFQRIFHETGTPIPCIGYSLR